MTGCGNDTPSTERRNREKTVERCVCNNHRLIYKLGSDLKENKIFWRCSCGKEWKYEDEIKDWVSIGERPA